MQWSQILASERTIDTTEWEQEYLFGPTGPLWTYSPYADPDVVQTLYMLPVRFSVFGATATPTGFNPSYFVFNERLYSAPKTLPPTVDSRHTFSIMPHDGLVPDNSHCGKLLLTSVEYHVPGVMTYSANIPGQTLSSTYYGEVDAARLWINGEDATGIVDGITPLIKLVNNAAFNIGAEAGYIADAQLQFVLDEAVELNHDDTIEIDVWYKIHVGGGWLPTITLGSLDRVRTDLTPSNFKFSDSRTYPALINAGVDSIMEAIGYIWELTLRAANANAKMPRRFPWILEYPEDSPWTFGDYGDIDFQSIPSSTVYSTISRPFVSQSVAPAASWTVTTVGNIDDAVQQPTAGDGAVCSYGPSALAPDVASGRWNFGVSGTQPVVKVVVWYCAKCDSNGDGSFTNIQLRYTSAGILRVRNQAVTTSLTDTFGYFSAEFTGADIIGFASVTSCQVQIDAALATVDGFVQLDVLYVDVQREGDVTAELGDSGIKLIHANKEEVSFQWGREVPEIILSRSSRTIPGAPSDPLRALYKPQDTGTYFSSGLITGPAYVEAAGVWDPNEDTVFSFWGVEGGEEHFGFPAPSMEFDEYFPAAITIKRI